MIDKSQSMNEPGKFDSLHKWVRDTLVTEMLIPEDWITVWEFYEKPYELQTLVIKNENDRNSLINKKLYVKLHILYREIKNKNFAKGQNPWQSL